MSMQRCLAIWYFQGKENCLAKTQIWVILFVTQKPYQLSYSYVYIYSMGGREGGRGGWEGGREGREMSYVYSMTAQLGRLQ